MFYFWKRSQVPIKVPIRISKIDNFIISLICILISLVSSYKFQLLSSLQKSDNINLLLTFTEVQLLPVKVVALNSSVTPWWSLSASALVSVAPLIIVAFIVERYLSKGNLSGALK